MHKLYRVATSKKIVKRIDNKKILNIFVNITRVLAKLF